MAEFLQGLAAAVGEQRRLNAAELARAFAHADRYARGALDEPQEGTILTAISATAASLAEQSRNHGRDLRAMLPQSMEAARGAVAGTRDTLPAMRKAGVEDAGAVGFLLLMEGIAATAMGRPPPEHPEMQMAALPDNPRMEHQANHGSDEQFRFCTECIVVGDAIDRRKMRDELALLGNSLVLAGGRNKVRIHIHVNEPGAVFDLAGRYGSLQGQKADDMTLQSRSRASRQRVVVVTDSGADIPEEILDELGIHTVPLRIHFADRTLLDKVGMTSEEFLREIATSAHHPTTSQPAPGDLRRVYDFLTSHHEHVIVISLLGKVSGTLQASRMAARRSASPERISIIDSQSVSVGQGLVAMYAAECARAGMPVADILKAVDHAVAGTRIFAVVTDLKYASRGGRLPRAASWLAQYLPVLPVLRIGGGVGISGFFRRGADPVMQLLRSVRRGINAGRRYRIAIAHAGLPGTAAQLKAAMAKAVPNATDILVTDLGAAASVHGGPGTLGVAVQEYIEPASVTGA